MDSRRQRSLLLGACVLLFAGCPADVSPVEPVLGAIAVEIGDADHQVVPIEAPPDSHVLITVIGRDVDIRAAIVSVDGTAGAVADAPNKRMGVETLLLEPPHANAFSVRIERNDHAMAHGTVMVDAVALPVITEGDRRRLKAAQLESTAGQLFHNSTRDADTVAAYASAADMHQKNGDDRLAGIALLHAAGARYVRVSDWQGAADFAGSARSMLDGSDEPELAAFALRLEGAALDQVAGTTDDKAQFHDQVVEQAREKLTEAAQRFEALGMSYEAGYAINYRGVSFLSAGDRDLARADFQKALELFKEAHDEPAQALSLQSLALMSHEDGRLADAVREFDQALALIPRDQDAENYAHTLHNSALPLRVLGRFDEAIARYYEAGQILHHLGDPNGEARALHGLGTTLSYAGEPERAKELLGTAIKLRGETGAKREQAVSMLVLGQIERSEGHTDVAIALHTQALALVTAPHDRAQALLALAQDYIAATQLSKARQELNAILQLDLPATDRYLGLALTELGVVESLDGTPAASNDAFTRAIAIHRKNGSNLEQARALYRRAEARMRVGDTESVWADTSAALKLFEEIGLQGTQVESRAAFRATYRGTIELRIAACLADSEAAERRGDRAGAQRFLRVALATSDQHRAQLLMDSDAPGFNKGSIPPELLVQRMQTYELLAGKRQRRDKLLEEANPDAAQLDALAVDISMLRAKATLLESRLARSHPVSTLAATPTPDELKRVIPEDALVAEYFLGDRHSWLFEVRHGVVAIHELPARAELELLASKLHVSWRTAARTPGDRLASSRKLAELIFAPLKSPGAETRLMIVPDGALHLVPMALLAQQALPDMRPGTAIVVPSLSARQADNFDEGEAPGKLLAVIADPIYAANDSRIRTTGSQQQSAGIAPLTRSARDLDSLQRLPATAVEAREIISLVNSPAKTLALIGQDANRERVAGGHLDEYRIVHFATHALADSQDPALATLALSRWDTAGKPLDGALRLYDITQLQLNADLVVLSGCDTALGREIAGEGPIGLSQAFLRTGARSVVSTLWKVSDTSTAILMREFYRQLLVNRRDASVALQLAQDYIRKQPRWSDPYYWAGFQLVSMARINRNNKVERQGE